VHPYYLIPNIIISSLMILRKILFLGPPGVGKGTYAKRAAPRLNCAHISPGDLLRRVAMTDLAISNLLESGSLVPQQTVFDLMEAEIFRIKQQPTQTGVILDGFPRNVEQAQKWILRDKDNIPDLVMKFSLPKELLVEKLLGRRVCCKCGDLYNVFSFQNGHYSMPAMLPKCEGICDSCGGHLSQRSDDNLETIKKRLELHQKVENDLVQYLGRFTTVTRFPVTTGIAQLDELVHSISHSLNISIVS
jgi:adenylate kinase